MNKELYRFKQQEWMPQLDVTIHEGGIVAVDGEPLYTRGEIALANVILRLNAAVEILKADIEKLKDTKNP